MDLWLILLVGGLIFLGLLVLLLLLYGWGYMQRLPLWTGLGYGQDSEPDFKVYEKVQIADETQAGQTTKHIVTHELQPGKTLWDWLQLLLIPVVIAVIAFTFNAGQASTNLQLEEQNRQEQVINTYLDQMSNLLLQYHLHESKPNASVRAIAQAITLTALDRLDSQHKNIILLFLYRADLLKYHYYQYGEKECGEPKVHRKEFADERPILTLAWGHVEGIKINGVDLSCIDLHNMYLEGSIFFASLLERADLAVSLATNADFSNTSLKAANLTYLDLLNANLQGANLQYARMWGICLSHAQLEDADLQYADLKAYSHSINHTILFCGQRDDATLTQANLSDAVLT